MDRPHYMVTTTNRPDVGDWLDEMIGNGWRLITVDQGIFYFEHLEMMVAVMAEAQIRDYHANGLSRQVLGLAAEAGMERAKRG